MKMMNFLSPQLLMVQMLKELLGLIFLYNWEFFDAFLVVITGTFSFGQNFVSVVQISDCRCIIGVFSGNLGNYFCES